jgi:hypothetical protein
MPEAWTSALCDGHATIKHPSLDKYMHVPAAELACQPLHSACAQHCCSATTVTCHTCVLPVALTALQKLHADLQASSLATAATLAVYLFASGLSALLWGPVCDCIGRRPTYIASTIAFVATSVGCAFAPTMWLLLLLRAFQGASSECCVANAAALIGQHSMLLCVVSYRSQATQCQAGTRWQDSVGMTV